MQNDTKKENRIFNTIFFKWLEPIARYTIFNTLVNTEFINTKKIYFKNIGVINTKNIVVKKFNVKFFFNCVKNISVKVSHTKVSPRKIMGDIITLLLLSSLVARCRSQILINELKK